MLVAFLRERQIKKENFFVKVITIKYVRFLIK